jgi:hypothetical protein
VEEGSIHHRPSTSDLLALYVPGNVQEAFWKGGNAIVANIERGEVGSESVSEDGL